MTIPGDVVTSVWDSLIVTIHALQDLPIPNRRILDQALTSLDDVLLKCTYESWTVEEANSALQKLGDALLKTSSLASKWKKRRIRIVLDKSTFVDELSNAVMEIQRSCGTLQARPNHSEAARAIGEQLGIVVQELRDGESGSELNIAKAGFKKELLNFLRVNHSKSTTSEDVISVTSWLAKYLGTEVHIIKQESQEIKENADTVLNAKGEMDTELLEQLILCLIKLEDESVILAKTKAKLICSICGSLMRCPVMIDNGLSFCKTCFEEEFKCGRMTCPDTSVTVNVTLQKVIACFGESEEQPAGETSTEEGESSDANFECHVSDENLERKAQIGLEYLDSSSYHKVLAGFSHLIKCASLPGGARAVFNAKYTRPPPAPPAPPAQPIVIEAIPAVIEKAKMQDSEFSKHAVKLMAALTSGKRGVSENGGGSDSEIILEVADAKDFLVSLMKEESFTRTRLLAAETVANILVNKEVRKMLRSYDGIVPALVALSNVVDTAGQSGRDVQKAHTVSLTGLQRLAKCSKRGDKTQMIVSALIKLLKRGRSYQPELESLVRDSLVALENQVLALDHATSTNEVCKVVWKERSALMVIKGNNVSHTSVLGRMASINIMTKLCGLYKEGIEKHVFLYLLRMISSTKSEIANLLKPSQEAEQLENLKELLVRSVRLLCFCVTHGKNTAQSVLSVYLKERRMLEDLLVNGETSGIFDESRLEILSILDQIDTQSTEATLIKILLKILVEMSTSKDRNCRQQVARKLRTLVEAQQHLTEFKQAGGIAALVALLEDPDVNCRRDALVALQALSKSMAIPVGQLSLETILGFLCEKEHSDAAIGLFDLMVKEKAVSAETFLKAEGALEAILNLLDKNPDSPGSQESASAVLEMAKEDQSVRARIAEPGLRGLCILVKYVRDHGTNQFKELLTTTLVLFCREGEAYQEAVIEADGQRFLLASLGEKISKEKAAQGLLELIENTNTIEKILEGGFVAIALRSIDGKFACTDIALGLSLISSIPEGMNQIYSDPSSVSALLTLLEHCPNPSGKDAAALIIARLYPLLYRKDDLTRQTKIAESCNLLLRYLDPLDIHHIKEFLQALAAIADEMKGRKMIHEFRGHELLIKHLSVPDTEIQGLVLKILSEMSSDASENGAESRDAKRIRHALMERKIGEKLFYLVKSDEFSRRTESMKDALILIRNLSLAGPYVCEQLAGNGAVNVLLEVLKRHENSLPIVTELAVKALEKFLDDPKGKLVFLKGGGIRSLVSILKVDAFVRAGDAFGRASVSTIIILTAVAKDPQNRRAACEAIYDCDILPALNEIIFYGESSRTRWQAAVLMKLLVMYGPTARVCVSIKDKGSIDALIALRNVQHCTEMAKDVLSFVADKNSRCKKYIEEAVLALDT